MAPSLRSLRDRPEPLVALLTAAQCSCQETMIRVLATLDREHELNPRVTSYVGKFHVSTLGRIGTIRPTGSSIRVQYAHHSRMSRARFSNRSPRRCAASTPFEIACANAISTT